MNDNRQDTIRFPVSRILEVAKALSGDVRVRILEALGDRPMSIGQLAEALGVAQPTVSINVQALEQVGLVASSQGANREKICEATCRSILLELPSSASGRQRRTQEIALPIGMYSHCAVQPTCGMVGRDGALIGSIDDPSAFYMPERIDAALLWFAGSGYVEYYFPNPLPSGAEPVELRFSAEVCAEAPGYRQPWPSDISLFINDKPIGVWESPGDFGDRKGKLTPDKWRSGTEYGDLTEWSVSELGSEVNGAFSSRTTIGDLGLAFNQPVRVRLEVRADANNANGLNLFGSGFGDYPQDLVLAFVRTEEPEA